MKTSLSLGVCLVLAALPVAHASGETASPTPNTTVSFVSLPVGEVSQPIPLNKLPRPSGSKADGFYVKREQRNYFTIHGEKPRPDARHFGMPSASACLRGSNDMFGGSSLEGKPSWAFQSEGTMSMGNQQTLLTVHREEVVLTDGRAMLETRDAVIDTRSLASKTLDHRSLAMGKIGEMVGNVQVYAMRSKDNVEFVVVVPDKTMAPQGMLMAHVSGNPQMFTASQCRHLRVTTPIKKGEGTAASVLLRMIDADPKGTVASDGDDGTVQRTLRTLAIHLSTSWLSGDAEPVISATSGWQGPSERQRLPAGLVGTIRD